MYLFSRRARLNSADGVAWAAGICEHSKKVSGQEIQLWANAFSPGYGTVTWTSWFADLPSLEAFFDKMAADPGYIEMTTGANFIEGVVDDGLMEVIAGEPNPDMDPQYVTGAQAVCASGNIVRAMTAGIEIAQKADAITGLSTMFVRSLTGPYGGVGWLTGYPDIAAIETANAAMAADAGWLEVIDSTEGAWVEDAAVTQQTMYRKLA